jgi:hypothetical protein
MQKALASMQVLTFNATQRLGSSATPMQGRFQLYAGSLVNPSSPKTLICSSTMSSASEFDKVPDGYPKLAALMSKDEDYIIFRRFSDLNARNLLYLQDELLSLENRLATIDNDLQKIGERDVLKSRERFCQDIGRKELVLDIRRLLAQYSM